MSVDGARPYSSIGMKDVFLDPPPSRTLPTAYLADKQNLSGCDSFLTWEISGTIKSCPEDFVVREIASRSRTRKFPTGVLDVVADLKDDDMTRQSIRKDEYPVKEETVISEELSKTRNVSSAGCKQEILEVKGGLGSQRSKDAGSYLEPSDVINRILVSLERDGRLENAETTLHRIQSLNEQILRGIEAASKEHVFEAGSYELVWVPAVSTDSVVIQDADRSKGGDRGAFHRCIQKLYPLLKTETKRKEESAGSPTGGAEEVWIRISVDDAFFGLVPGLFSPLEDLIALYQFRNRGCVAPSDVAGVGRGRKGRKRGRTSDRAIPVATLCDESQVLLRLRPDLSRDERRPLHHLISKQWKQFATSTVDLLPESEGAVTCVGSDASSGATTAIAVQWSHHARKAIRSKNERRHSLDESTNTLCVLKKIQKEHLNALQLLKVALRCRQSDIGVAGIKDMHAVTYQFCTIRGMPPEQVAVKTRAHLQRSGLELGSFSGVDWTLSHGDLSGNRFEVVLRDLKRIHVKRMKDDTLREEIVPCDSNHFHRMTDRLRRCGFVNFYGEQRLGAPGTTEEAGYRPFDIGRAMIQKDFAGAIDRLLKGRRDVERTEVRHARQVWVDSQGDAVATLKALPKGGVMARERIVLQGLKRYGSSDPLAALRCLPFAVRTFWINAYQSLVWNTMTSERLHRFGLNVVEGDLYTQDDKDSTVRVVSSDMVSSVKMCQIVLPLPGYNVMYPTNEIGNLYRTFLDGDKVSFCRDSPVEATARGSYRKIVATPTNLELFIDASNSEEADCATLKFDLSSGSYATVLLRELMVTTIARGDSQRSAF